MTIDKAVREARIKEVVERHFPGRPVAYLEEVPTGIMHWNYHVEFADRRKAFYRSYRSEGPAMHKTDVFFGDPISLERELAVMNLLRQTAVPVPDVYASEEDAVLGRYALLSYVEGIHFRQYLDEHDHKLDVFFEALRKIGRTLASTRRVTFLRFGSIQPGGIGGARSKWTDRLADILLRHELNPRVRSYFTEAEWFELHACIETKLDLARAQSNDAMPQLVIYDLHVRNFNVWESGEHAGDISGAFDVEFAQAAHRTLEWGLMNTRIFPLYGVKWLRAAKDAFFEGYRAGGGDDSEDPLLEEIYLINDAISSVGIYDGVRDGIRDTWSIRFARYALEIVRGDYDRGLFVDISRPLHKAPKIA